MRGAFRLGERSGGTVELFADARLDDGYSIPELYSRYGRNSSEHLCGEFAFALREPSDGSIFCARDVFGVKPFYYCLTDGCFLFSTSLTDILEDPRADRSLDEDAIADHLLWDESEQTRTVYRGIRRLPPAHTLTIDPNGGATLRRYWRLDSAKETKLGSDEAYARRFRELFTEAVRSRLPRRGPAGCLLSGGLDSSSIAVVARDILLKKGESLDTFSLLFGEGAGSDERRYSRSVSTLTGIRPHEIPADAIAPFGNALELFERLGSPSAAELSILSHGIYPEALRAGVSVLLDGDGGDEVVSRGYLRLAELLKSGRGLEYLRTLSGLRQRTGRSFTDLLISQSLRPLVPRPALRLWRRMRWGERALWFDRELFNADFARRVHLADREAECIRAETSPARSVKELHLRELESGALAQAFEAKAALGDSYGIEHRYPFHDRALTEFCLSLPSDQKCYRGWTRVVLRRALEGLLPDTVRWRGGKTYLSDGLVRRLSRFEIEAIEHAVVRNPEPLEPYYDIGRLRAVYGEFQKRPSYRYAIILWQATQLSLWLRSIRTETANV